MKKLYKKGGRFENNMDFLEMIKQLYSVEKVKGYAEHEINFVKELFGTLPQIIEDFWRIAGCTEELHYGQDHWITPDNFRKSSWLRDSDYLILLNENQGVCQAGIHKSDLEKTNPPVYVSTVDGKNWTLCAKTASEFLQAALAYQAVFTFEYNPEAFFWFTQEEVQIVQSRLEKKLFELHGWIDIDLSFYSNAPDNMVVIMDCEDVQVLYGAASEKGYQKLMEVMEGLGEA